MSSRQLQLLICKPPIVREDFADPAIADYEAIDCGYECGGDIVKLTVESGLTSGHIIRGESNPIEIYDDDETFWSAFPQGSGSLASPILTEETTEVQKGTSSLKINIGSGSYQFVGVIHTYASLQDWSNKKFLCLWLYGLNDSSLIRVNIRFITSGWTNVAQWLLTDNWSGWKRFVLPFDNPDSSSGTVDWSQVKDVLIRYSSTGTRYLDRTVVDVWPWAIDASKYKYLITRMKGDGNFFIDIYEEDSWSWKVVQAETAAPVEETVYCYDLSSVTSGTVANIRLGVAGGAGKKASYDMFLFVESEPFYDDEDLGDVFDIPRYAGGVSERTDLLQLVINNRDGKHKERFAYRDEVYLWLKKDTTDFQRIFGGYIDDIDPESVQYGKDYLTLNMLGWSALLYERFIAESYADEEVDVVAKDILSKAENQAVLGFTTFGIKDVQKQISVLKCDYDEPLKKLTEMVEQLDLCFHVEPNRDASLYPKGKRFLRWADWMEDHFERGWTGAATWSTDGDIVSVQDGYIERKNAYALSVDSTIYKYLILRLRRKSGSETQFYVKVRTSDGTYGVQTSVSISDSDWQIRVYDLTQIGLGSSKTITDLFFGAVETVEYDWAGFFPSIPHIQEMREEYYEGNFECDGDKLKVGTLIVNEGQQAYLYDEIFTSPVSILAPTLTKDLANDKYSEIFYLVNKREETSPIEVYDDDETFWSVFAEGSGSLGSAALSEETTEVVKGTSSLKIVLGAGSYLRSGVQHDYGAGTEADWSGKEFICVYLYGINDGGTIRVDSFMPDGANQRYIEFTDNFSGWGRFVIPFNKMTSIGSPNPSTVRNIRVTYTTTGTRYIDRMVVDVGNWITIEGLVPDTLLQGSGSAFRWKLSSWDESAGDFHTNPFATLFDNGNPGGSGWIYLEFLDETLSSNIWSGQAEAYTIFPEGERGEAKDKLYGNVSSIIYSLYYGTLNRIGFAVKMPPSTESDDLTGSNAINKVKLKLEVYYAGTPDGVTTVNELLRLDALRNVKAGAFIRDPKKARNLIIVKGDKFTYNVPPDPDEWTREPAPTVIYDDDESFWSPSQVGTGSLAAPTLSEETGIVAKNGSSLKLTAGGAGTRQWVGCKHEYATYPDWSGFNFVGIHVYGVNDSATLRLKIKLAGQNYNCDFATDNFTGWKFFVVPFKDFSGTDKDWSRVQSIRVLRDTDATWYIDYMVVGVKRYFWGAKWCTLTNDPDAKVGIYSLKAQLDVGVLNNFYRLSSGLIEHDDFTTNWDTGFWEEEGQGAGGDIYDAYVQGDELVCKIKEVANAKEAHAGVVSKSKIDLTKGYVFEVKVIPDVQGSPPRGNRHEHAELRLTKSGDKTKDPELEENAPGIQFGAVINSDHFNWYSYEHWWESGQFKTEPLWSGKNDVHPVVLKLVVTEAQYKAYVDNDPVFEKSRQHFTENDGYVWLDADGGGNFDMTEIRYEKFDNFKLYKDTKIYVEGLAAGWKVELWSGTQAAPGEKKVEATVPAGSSVAEFDCLTIDFPFTGFFKVYDAQAALDHTSPDYSDIWGGDHYKAKQVAADVEHLVYFPESKDLALNALALKKLKFWFKHDVAGGGDETARLILATDDDNYYYTDFSPVSKWKELFEFDMGWIQNILFEEVGSPSLKNLNWVAFLYPTTSQVNWLKIDEFRFEGESEAWGIARDEAKIAEYGLQPEKVTSSYFKTPEDAQTAAEYFLSLLKDPPLVRGSLTHPWGLPQIRAGDTAVVNVPNQDINNEEMIIREVFHVIPPASTKLTTEVNLAGVPHAMTDPQKRLKDYIERLQKADVYAEKVELFTPPVREGLSIQETVSAIITYLRTKSFTADVLLKALNLPKSFLADVVLKAVVTKQFAADTKLVTQLFFDNFNDNSLDTAKWDELTGNGGQVAETNQRIEITFPVNGAATRGLVSDNNFSQGTDPVYLRGHVKHPSGTSSGDLVYARLGLAQQHELNPPNEQDHLVIYLERRTTTPANKVEINKKVNGVGADIYSGSWLDEPEMDLKIKLTSAGHVTGWKRLPGGSWVQLYDGDTDIGWTIHHVHAYGGQWAGLSAQTQCYIDDVFLEKQ